MQPLSPTAFTGSLANQKYKPARRADPYLKLSSNSARYASQNETTRHPRATKHSLINQSLVEELALKADIMTPSSHGQKWFQRPPQLNTGYNNQQGYNSMMNATGLVTSPLASTGFQTVNSRADAKRRKTIDRMMDCQTTKYDLQNGFYVHYKPHSDKISQANQKIIEITEGQINSLSPSEQQVGAIMKQAQARTLLGKSSGSFLRRHPKPHQTKDERNRILFDALDQRREQLDDKNDVEALYSEENKLGDSFLPSLRSFVPQHNITKLNKEIYETKAQLYKQQKRIQESKVYKIKQIERTVEPEKLSLYEKQQFILTQGLFQQNVRKDIINTAVKSPVKGWLQRASKGSIARLNESQDKKRKNSGSESHYSLNSSISDESLTRCDDPAELKTEFPLREKEKWVMIEEEERARLKKKWIKLFGQDIKEQPAENVQTLKDENTSQYYFDTDHKMGLLTDQLTPEEQAQVLKNFYNLIAMRNKDKLRVNELAQIVQHSDLINMEILKQFEGLFNLETKEAMTRIYLDQNAQELEALIFNEPNIEYEDLAPMVSETMLFDETTQRKHMLQPHKQLEFDEFSKNLLTKIIQQNIADKKFDPNVMNQKLNSEHTAIQNIKKALTNWKKGPVPSLTLQQNQFSAVKRKQLAEGSVSSASSVQKIDVLAKRNIFKASKIKSKFYDVAKYSKDTGEQDCTAMRRFFESCLSNQIAASPIFSKIQNGICSIIGYFISKEQAQAIGQLISALKDSKDLYFEEVIFDYNGMKDEQFAVILKALQSNKALKKITYVNNEMGHSSVLELNTLLKGDNGHNITELRVASVKVAPLDLKLLLEGIQKSNGLQCLRLSKMQINDSVLVKELSQCVHKLPELRELNLSYQGFLPQQLSEIMFTIAEFYPKIQSLNLSGNPLPHKQDNKHSLNFVTQLTRLIDNNNQLVDLDLSDMNLGQRVEKLQWAIVKSKSLQSLHLSNNEIPQNVLCDLLMVFGIRRDKGQDELFTAFQKAQSYKPRVVEKVDKQISVQRINSLLDPQMARTQIGKFSGIKKSSVSTFDEATAQIANSEQLREAKDKIKQVQSEKSQGIAYSSVKTQPIVISRVLHHNELVFNQKHDKNTHFEKAAGEKWRLGEKCWICDRSRYTVIVFNRETASKYFTQITEDATIKEIRRKYKLDYSENFIEERPDSVQIMGTFTDNVVCNMLNINLFNLLIDKQELQNAYGPKQETVVDETINAALGLQNKMCQIMKQKDRTDSYGKLFKSLPFPAQQVTMLGITHSMELRGDHAVTVRDMISSSDRAPFQSLYSNEDILVYAGYLQPGKHQMVIHDRKTNIYYQRDFITDVRNCEILSYNFEYVPFETNSQIKHHSDVDGNVWMDLHSSVFMNFTRITYQTVSECFTNDMQFCRMRNIVGSDYDLMTTKKLMQEKYSILIKFFHRLCAQYLTFPHIELSIVPKVFEMLGILTKDFADQLHIVVGEAYKELREESHRTFHLNRMYFVEVVLLYIDAISQMDDAVVAGSPLLKLIQKAPYASKYTDSLCAIFKIFQQHANDSTEIEFSLTNFRTDYVWKNTVNSIFYSNLQGLMTLFSKYRSANGLTHKGAIKLTEDSKMKLAPEAVRRMFNLSQMTVLDELNASNEYLVMDFVEYLELIVRLAFIVHKSLNNAVPSQSDLEKTLAQMVTDLLAQVQVPYMEPLKPKMTLQLDELDYRKLSE